MRIVYTIGSIWLWVALVFTGCQESGSEPEANTPFTLIDAAHSGVTFQQDLALAAEDVTGLGDGGKGVAIGDVNNDGLPDLFFTGGVTHSALYLNKGNFQFEEVAEKAGIRDPKDKGETTGVLMADVNGDGWLDIYLLKAGLQGDAEGTRFTNYGANLLYINNGDGSFTERGAQYNLNVIGFTRTANFFDYDNDGDLDVYLMNLPGPGRSLDFEYYNKPPKFKWLSDRLYENQDNYFVDVSEEAGLLFERNLGQSISVADVNNDGWLDVYVANDFFGRDFLYVNNGDKSFTERASEYFKVTSMSAMGSDFGDVNNDGKPDLFTGEMMPEGNYRQKLNLVPFSLEIYNKMARDSMRQYTRNTLQLNTEGKGYAEVGMFAGIEATEWSWGSVFADFDNDGFQDLFIANGIKRDMTNMDYIRGVYGKDIAASADPNEKPAVSKTKEIPSVRTSNYMYRNNGDLRFEDVSDSWGLAQPVHSRGVAYSDLDNDGDLDLVLNNIDTIPFIYRNNSAAAGNNYLRIRLKGNKNTYGLGAVVKLYTARGLQMRQLSSMRGFSSTSEPIVHFGLKDITNVDSVVVNWPGSGRQVVLNPKINGTITIEEQPQAIASAQTTPTLLHDLTEASGLNYQHKESKYNDFKQYRIHHRKLSNEGPGMAAGDVNGDGLDDIFIGGAKGNSGVLYVQQADGRFKAGASQPWQQALNSEDLAALFFDGDNDGDEDLYIASGSIEFKPKASGLTDRLYLNDGKGNFTLAANALPVISNSTACITAGDMDGDGDLDLFVGGRFKQGEYPRPGRSYLLLNEGGTFKDVTADVPGLNRIGMVTDARWTDKDGDGDADLLLVGEWMAVSWLQNDGGKLQAPIKVANSNGWWNTIHAVDIDTDGDMDYVLGNLGQNSIFKATPSSPVYLQAGDFDGNKTLDPVVFREVDGVLAPFVNRDLFCSQMPKYNNLYYNFERYARADMENIFGEEEFESVLTLTANELRSCILLNKGADGFELQPLPYQAQLSPVYGIQSADVNGDGKLDLLLAGNTTANHFEYGPTFGFRGLVLLGDGSGNFKAITNTGWDVPGEARGIAQLKSSGKSLFVVANNNAGVQVFDLNKPAN